MVYEFTGASGELWATITLRLSVKDRSVYEAIREQYYPVGENSPLPSNHIFCNNIYEYKARYPNGSI